MPSEQVRPAAATAATASTTRSPSADSLLGSELSGLDVLERPAAPRQPLLGRVWKASWPKVAAVLLGLGIWQLVVWSGHWPEYVLPGPATVFRELVAEFQSGVMPKAIGITVTRAVQGYLLAVTIGGFVGLAVSRSRTLRSAVGSLITGLQTMPSIAWFPLAILLFKLTDAAILFVVVLGAAPSIANGIITGADNVPPILLRAGRVLGARGLNLSRFVILPASMPSVLAGLKQGWAFAWRSLMAGEIIVIIANQPSIGFQLQAGRDLADAPALMAAMVVILVIGIVVDSLVFGTAERIMRGRRGLIDPAA
jgi:NitT/TauT family transport system permease protein